MAVHTGSQFVALLLLPLLLLVGALALATQGRAPPRRMARSTESSPQPVDITLHGGSVLTSIRVYHIYWSGDYAFRTPVEAFVTCILQSAYIDWLAEYSTSSRTPIGRGIFMGSTQLAGPVSGRVSRQDVTDALVAGLKNDSLLAASLNQQDALYMFYFDSSVTLTLDEQQGPQSCSPGGFTGYHSYFFSEVLAQSFLFAVIADCTGPAAAWDVQLDAITATVSHEIIEAITDPYGSGWYQRGPAAFLEIADVCEFWAPFSCYGTVWQVNPGWSNTEHACVVAAGDPVTPEHTQTSAAPSRLRHPMRALPLASWALALLA